MATAEQIMSKAISYLGVKEVPSGSNNVLFNTDYYGRAVSGYSYPWCCSFIWDIFRMCGASDLFYNGGKTAYVPAVVNWARKEGLIVDKKSGRYGDIITFDWDGDGVADHIGFIESYNGVYHTIEGNTAVGNDSNGGCVMRRDRNVSTVLSVIRPRYDNVQSVPTSSGSTSESWKGDKRYYLSNPRVGEWQAAMNKGFDTDELDVDNKFGAGSQAFAGTHLLWAGQKHNCITAIRWLRKTLHDVYGFTKLSVNGYWDNYLTTCVKVFQKNRGLTADGVVGLITTYWLLTGDKR